MEEGWHTDRLTVMMVIRWGIFDVQIVADVEVEKVVFVPLDGQERDHTYAE